MKQIRRSLNLTRITNWKYTKNYRHAMNSITFFKSNYKYKRRITRCNITKTKHRKQLLACIQQERSHKHKLPAKVENMTDDKKFTKKTSFYDNIKVDKFLRIFIFIMQQATSTSNETSNNIIHFYLGKSKCDNDKLVTQLVAKIKAINNANKKSAEDIRKNYEDEDGNRKNWVAYKNANNDFDINVDNSNATGKISYQQHNYNKVSIITSTPISCQRRNHHQFKATNSPLSTTTIATFTIDTLLPLPAIENYKTDQWIALLRHYVRENPSSQQYQYHHKHIQHHNHNASYKSSLTTRGLLSIDCSSNNIIGRRNITPSATGMGTSIQSAIQYDNATWNRSYTLFYLLFGFFIAFSFGIRSTTAGACWQTVLDNGKCNEIFSLNINKSECCGANQEFAYTEREPTNVEYFFATAIGGGMECSPCLESCINVKCEINKKCVKRKGRPKCVCAPECGAARRKRKQIEKLTQQLQYQSLSHFIDDKNKGGDLLQNVPSANRSPSLFNIKLEKLQQSRDTRSLSSKITNVNLGLKNGKDAMTKSNVRSPIERHHSKKHNHNQNQRKIINIQMQHDDGQQHSHLLSHRNQEPKTSRRVLIIANVEHTEKPTTRRLQVLSNVRTTQARRHNIDNKRNKYGQHENTDLLCNNEKDYEDYNYNDAEDDAKQTKKNKNNRSNDSNRFFSQSPSRHMLKTKKTLNSNNNKKKKRNKNHHDLQTTKIRQHLSENTTSVIQQNGRHAEKASHHRYHNYSHYQHQQQKQQQELHHKSNQPQSRTHSKHKHNISNKQHHKQQTIVLKKPKKNKDYNITTTTNIAVDNSATITTAKDIRLSNSETNETAVNATSSTLLQTRIVQITTTTPTSLILSSPSGAILTTTFNTAPQDTQSNILLSSITSSTFSTTPLNSAMSTDYDAAADDHYRSRLRNRGSKTATSSLLSRTSSSSSSASNVQLFTVSAHSSLDFSVATTMSAKGEGVLLHDHRFEFSIKKTHNNKSNNNNDDTISAFQSNLHSNQQKNEQQTQPQSLHHNQTPLFDGISQQLNFIGFPNNKQQVTNGDHVKPFNPVCGTDGRTYNTECQLRKRACRTDNPKLQIAYLGHCRTTCNGVTCFNGLTCVEDQYLMPHCIECKIECPHDDYNNNVVDATKAVCGADGKTYKSTCDINRMICKIGRSIGVAYPGPCRENQVTCDDINCGPKQVCLIDLLTHKPRCTSCRYKCSRKRRPSSPHFEQGKICGFNNRTYNSWCEMRKDSCSTGFYIDVKYSGDCHITTKL